MTLTDAAFLGIDGWVLVAVALAWVLLFLFVVSLMRAAKRADDQCERALREKFDERQAQAVLYPEHRR
jgi:hypothetical protein